MLRKEISEPHYSNIFLGRKPVEGRLRVGDWKTLEVGQPLVFFNSKDSLPKGVPRQFTVVVDMIVVTDSFEKLIELTGTDIMPDKKTPTEILEEYYKINLPKYDTVDNIQKVAKFEGVVGVYVEVQA